MYLEVSCLLGSIWLSVWFKAEKMGSFSVAKEIMLRLPSFRLSPQDG
jgi:hypothetical protein